MSVEQAPKCTCRIEALHDGITTGNRVEVVILFCALHSAAPDLLAALKWAFPRTVIDGPVLRMGHTNWQCYSCDAESNFDKEQLDHTAACLWAQARAAIAKATSVQQQP